MTTLDRRRFLQGALALGGGALAPTMAAAPVAAGSARPGESPYGSLDGIDPDDNGIILPPGFTSRVIGVAGEPVAGTAHPWHPFPDGAATFPDGAGGWYYACNSEVMSWMARASGGVSAVHFGSDGRIVDAYPILTGSHSNCAGGPTPWGTWLSCEEDPADRGLVWECDPTGVAPAVAHEAIGRWRHEAAAVDPIGQRVYLTEDRPDGLLYRFTPAAYPDLSSGRLEAAVIDGTAVGWTDVPDPTAASTLTREQVPGATRFRGGEGIWRHDGFVYFTTKGDDSVHAIELASQTYRLLWRADPSLGAEAAVLTGVDNITASAATGDLFVAEDGGNMEVVIITPAGEVAPFCRVVGHPGSEITGPCFDPSGHRLYFSSQRAPTGRSLAEIVPAAADDRRDCGVTYEITGPFAGAGSAPSTTPGTTATTSSTAAPSSTTSASATSPPPSSAPAETSTAVRSTAPPMAAPSETSATTPSPVTTLAAVSPSTSPSTPERRAADGDGGGIGTGLGVGVAAALGVVLVVARHRSRGDDPGPDVTPGPPS